MKKTNWPEDEGRDVVEKKEVEEDIWGTEEDEDWNKGDKEDKN